MYTVQLRAKFFTPLRYRLYFRSVTTRVEIPTMEGGGALQFDRGEREGREASEIKTIETQCCHPHKTLFVSHKMEKKLIQKCYLISKQSNP